MAFKRVIPILLIRNKGMVKTVRFKNARYIGDPVNAVKIFNEKEVDELIFLDVDASRERREPSYDFLREIASECFFPLAYGGGVTSIEQIRKLIQIGFEKIILNAGALRTPALIEEASSVFGSSTIVGSMDVKKNIWGKNKVYDHVQKKTLAIEPVAYAKKMEKLGVGELFVNSVDRDGTMNGYDLDLIASITQEANVSVIASGGCSSADDIRRVLNESRASAAAAGSFFIFQGPAKAVLITYPQRELMI